MSTYRCRYCRLVHDGSEPSCPLCGAPIDITARVTDLVYWDATVDLTLHLERPRNLGVASMKDPHSYRIVLLRLHGPGRVAVQSVYELAESTGKLDVFSFGSTRLW
ncbi:MAG: hypothetical protein ABSB76_17250 [Streptosporangiaceae bacterium]|jgi:hypothetical protein